MPEGMCRRVEDLVRQAWGARDIRLVVSCHALPGGMVELRVVSALLEGLDSLERETMLWQVLRTLAPGEAVRMTYSLLLTPDEARRYFAEPSSDDRSTSDRDSTDGFA